MSKLLLLSTLTVTLTPHLHQVGVNSHLPSLSKQRVVTLNLGVNCRLPFTKHFTFDSVVGCICIATFSLTFLDMGFRSLSRSASTPLVVLLQTEPFLCLTFILFADFDTASFNVKLVHGDVLGMTIGLSANLTPFLACCRMLTLISGVELFISWPWPVLSLDPSESALRSRISVYNTATASHTLPFTKTFITKSLHETQAG